MNETNRNPAGNTPVDDELIVSGFQFDNFRDAQEAIREQRNIAALKSKIDFTQTDDMVELYHRLVERKVFKTPVGYQFLGEFREYLVEELKMEEQEVPYIYVESTQGISRMQREQLEFLQNENIQLEQRKRKFVIAIGVLTTMIIAMFLITIFNPNVGYINTENKILNRYAAWEEELTRREAQVREREAELGIEADTEQETESNSSEE